MKSSFLPIGILTFAAASSLQSLPAVANQAPQFERCYLLSLPGNRYTPDQNGVLQPHYQGIGFAVLFNVGTTEKPSYQTVVRQVVNTKSSLPPLVGGSNGYQPKNGTPLDTSNVGEWQVQTIASCQTDFRGEERIAGILRGKALCGLQVYLGHTSDTYEGVEADRRRCRAFVGDAATQQQIQRKLLEPPPGK